MPDQYDPKVSPRPSADRRAADPRRGVDNDPLAELAKIVQGRPTAVAAQSRDPARAPANGSSGGHADLEAELLSDLQASFAAVREVLPPAAPRARPPVAEEAPAFAAPQERAALPPT